MWNNSQWEQENQELLKEWYLDKVTGKAPDSAVRKIHCEGCGGIFYTRIHSKRYCNCWCAKLGNWKHQRQRRLAARADRVCAVCGKKFIPPGLTPSTAPTPAARTHTASVLRLNQVVKMDT